MDKQLKILAIVGMTGSGKSVAANFFRNKGLPILRFGDQTDLGLKELGIEINVKNERWYREKLRHDLGMAAYAIKIEPRIRKTAETYTKIVLDGLYSWEEYLYLSKRFPQLKILCIYAPPVIRHKRLVQRIIRPLNEKEAHGRDVAEIEKLNKGGPIAIADYLIRNDTTLDHFYQQLEKFHQTYDSD